jgi:undecaprenyl-diphosphatase
LQHHRVGQLTGGLDMEPRVKAILRTNLVQFLVRWDQLITLQLNRAVHLQAVHWFFSNISHLGNGRFWYVLMLLLALLHGFYGIAATLHMGVTGLVTLLVYRTVKGAAQRPRPGAVHESIRLGCAAIDEYSFPSGHTMHAVAFTLVAVAWFPALLGLLWTFSLLTGLARIILGLHYPTDVILGAVFGALVGYSSLLLAGL